MTTALYTAKDFILLSLPENAKPSQNPETDVATWLENGLISGRSYVSEFPIPDFKIGSLDTLVLQSEELSKIDSQIYSSLQKITEILHALTETQPSNLTINKQSIPEYLTHFQWDSRKFKLDKSVKELIHDLSIESFQLDADVRSTFANYNNAKSNFAAAERKKTGDLSVRSLHDIVKAEDFILDSEYLTTVLVAVPKNLKQDFEKHYETLAEKVVPGSASVLKQDEEFLLYNVHLFKKFQHEFQNACRERKYIPRDFAYSEELIDQLKKEHDTAASQEQSLRVQLIRLAKTAFQDVFVNWLHIKALRVYVESVLRYGLPPFFLTKIIAVPPKQQSSCKSELIEQFSYLAGNAFSKDKRGKINRNDTSLHEYASLVDTEYEPFVLYSIQLPQ
ncbi:unnamed protein product [Kluyveromyces dobzhanskii CBS 2104]|uniref:V-type proton ATPase subunit C n=1 Tax=Kluyveromyces dobzhanskii CBS 2104 TaxID=1427455 RepID=A0A0A8LDM9_9SACH|nr:unnamed protein product [Kluyveromyces dobzhanskii CBS 2104]